VVQPLQTSVPKQLYLKFLQTEHPDHRSVQEATSTMDTTKALDNPEAELKSALETFEACLLRPVVSGDFAAWAGELQHSWGDASAQIHFHVRHLHPRQYDEISKQDPELLPRIELLRAEDAAIEEQRAKLNQSVARVAQHGPKLEPDEEKAQKHTKPVLDEATSFIARVRKQSLAVQTWYMEAFNRDGGAVD